VGLIAETGRRVLGGSLGPFCYDAVSLLGRIVSRPYVPSAGSEVRLNLGCGTRYLDGFVNVDFFLAAGRRDYGADLRYPLNMPAGMAAGIFSEHTLEHLTYSQVDRLLKECYRILEPGARVRLIVPDIRIVAEAYARDDKTWFAEWERVMFVESEAVDRRSRRLFSHVQALSFLLQEHGHRSCWDYDTLAKFLAAAGFSDICRSSFRQGRDASLLVDSDVAARRIVSLYVEGAKATG